MDKLLCRACAASRTLLLLLTLVSLPSHAQVAPVLTAVSPTPTAAQLASVAIDGANLQQTGFVTAVTFAGTPVPAQDMLVVTAQRLVVLVPAGATSGPLVVTVGGVASNALAFTVVEGDFVPDEVLAKVIPGAAIGRVIATTRLDLVSIIPLGGVSYLRLHIADGRGIPQAIRDLIATGLVENASANFFMDVFALPSLHNQPTPNDPLFPQQYGPQRIRAVDAKFNTPDAHFLSRGSGVTIAILDTGIDPAHEDLAAKILRGINFTSVVEGDPDTADLHSHGTHVAGIAAAVTSNLKGIVGIAPKAKLLPAKVMFNGRGNNAVIAEGISFAAKRANVLNMSLGGSVNSDMIADEVRLAVGRGRVVVAAAGNGGGSKLGVRDPECFPAALSDPLKADGIISVANTTADDNVALGAMDNPGLPGTECGFPGGGSNKNDRVDVGAPGTSVLSTIPPGALPELVSGANAGRALLPAECQAAGTAYCKFSGTSMAAPHVAGLAALMLERDPKLTPVQVECLIRLTAVDILDSRAKNTAVGDGRVDAYAAVHAVLSLNGRFELLPFDCNTWKPVGGQPLPPFIPFGGIVIPLPPPPPPFPPLPPLLLPPPPGALPGLALPDQVVPVTTESKTAFVATAVQRTVKVDLTDNSVTAFPGFPVSDAVMTPDNQFALVTEFEGVGLNGKLRRIRLSNNQSLALDVAPPVTELTITPNSRKALLGTVDYLAVADIANFTPASLKKLEVDATTGISVTPDSRKALVGDPASVVIVDLASLKLTHVATGIPITGIALTPDGLRAAVGVAGGVSIIDVGAGTAVAVGSGTPISAIAIAPDNGKAVYATLAGLVIVDLATRTFSVVPTPLPVTDVDITSDSATAVVGTSSGVSVARLTSATATHLALPTPLQSGISVSRSDRWASVGVATGVAIVDIPVATVQIAPASTPVTNVAITPDSTKGVVGTVTGIAIVDLATKTASAIAMSRPLITPTIAPDGLKAVVGTTTGVSVIDVATVTSTQVAPTPPVLNVLPDDEQGPLNPSAERGRGGSLEG